MDGTRNELAREREDLVSKLSRAEADIEAIKSEMAVRLKDVQGDAERLRSRIANIDDELARREAADAVVPTVSDHALLRYIERVCGVDIDALKDELLTDAVVLAIKSGATGVKTPHGTMVIKGSTVVTFKTDDMDRKRRVQKSRRYHEATEDDWGDV